VDFLSHSAELLHVFSPLVAPSGRVFRPFSDLAVVGARRATLFENRNISATCDAVQNIRAAACIGVLRTALGCRVSALRCVLLNRPAGIRVGCIVLGRCVRSAPCATATRFSQLRLSERRVRGGVSGGPVAQPNGSRKTVCRAVARRNSDRLRLNVTHTASRSPLNSSIPTADSRGVHGL